MRARPLLQKIFSNPSLASFFSRSLHTKRPPVLLLAENHWRPAARQLIYDNFVSLKKQGFNMFMCEGIGAGHVDLQKALLQENRINDMLELLCFVNPKIYSVMNNRYHMSYFEFYDACKAILPGRKSIGLIDYLGSFHPVNLPLYERMQANHFVYQNVDADFSSSMLLFPASRLNMNFRDTHYAEKISQAYRQGHGVIAILGSLHVLPDPDPNPSLSSFFFGRRQLITDRLSSLNVPFITVLPFNSKHKATDKTDEILHNNKSAFPYETHVVDVSDRMNYFNPIEQALKREPTTSYRPA